MTVSPELPFDTPSSPKRFFLTNGEELTASLERGYLDLCSPVGLLVEDAPSPELLSRVTNRRSAGYPVLLELTDSTSRVTSISDVSNVFLRDQKSLTHQQQAIPSLNPFSELPSAVREDLFVGSVTDPVPPPVGDDLLLERLERRASAITAVVVARKTAEVGRPFIEAILHDEPSPNPLVTAISSHRYGRTQSPVPVAEFVEMTCMRMLQEREETLGSSKMAKIIEEVFVASGLTDDMTMQVLADINGFVSSIGGDLGRAEVFTPLHRRLTDGPLSGIHAIANLLVMRPRLSDLLVWPVEEHGAREDQYMAAAYLLGLTQERRLQPASMRPRSLDTVLVRSIAVALDSAHEAIPSTTSSVSLNTSPTEALRINGERVTRIGPAWDKPTAASKPRPTHQGTSGTQPDDTGGDNSITGIIGELSEWLRVGSELLRRLERLAPSSTRQSPNENSPEVTDSTTERTGPPKKPSSRRAKLGSAARKPDPDTN